MGTTAIIAIILSVLNMTLLLTFRFLDKRRYGYDEAKDLKDQLVTDIRNSDDVFKRDIADISATLSNQEKQVKSYINLLKTELDNMMTYKEDFKLCNMAINNCKNAVQGLISLTEESTERTKRVEEIVVTLKEMESSLSDFSKEVTTRIRDNSNKIIIETTEELNKIKAQFSQDIKSLNHTKNAVMKGEDPTFNLDWNAESNN